MGRRLKIREDVWQNLDWNRTAAEIANNLTAKTGVHVTPKLVWAWAKRLGRKTAAAPRGHRKRADWDHVNWSRPVADIAAELGVSVSRASFVRRRSAAAAALDNAALIAAMANKHMERQDRDPAAHKMVRDFMEREGMLPDPAEGEYINE